MWLLVGAIGGTLFVALAVTFLGGLLMGATFAVTAEHPWRWKASERSRREYVTPDKRPDDLSTFGY